MWYEYSRCSAFVLVGMKGAGSTMGFLMFSVILDSETISIAFDTVSLSAHSLL